MRAAKSNDSSVGNRCYSPEYVAGDSLIKTGIRYYSELGNSLLTGDPHKRPNLYSYCGDSPREFGVHRRRISWRETGSRPPMDGAI